MGKRGEVCRTCGGAGRVWLPMPDEILVFYGPEVKAEKDKGAELTTVFRCDECAGTGRL
jgi:DnaJ-class molecular chaperone